MQTFWATDNARLVLGIYGYETYHTFADKACVIFNTSGHSYITTCKDLILTIIHLQFHQCFSTMKYQFTRESGRHHRAYKEQLGSPIRQESN